MERNYVADRSGIGWRRQTEYATAEKTQFEPVIYFGVKGDMRCHFSFAYLFVLHI